MKSRVIIISLGSHGELLPLLSIGQQLKARGIVVTVIASAHYSQIIARCSLNCELLPTGSSSPFADSGKSLLRSRYADLWQIKYGVDLNMRLFSMLREISDRNTMLLTVNRPYIWADLYAYMVLDVPAIRFDVEPTLGVTSQLPSSPTLERLAVRFQLAWASASRALGLPANGTTLDRLSRRVAQEIPILPLFPNGSAGVGNPSGEGPGFLPPPSIIPDTSADEAAGLPDSRRSIIFVAGTDGTIPGLDDQFFFVSCQICKLLDCNGYFLGGRPPRDMDTCRFRWMPFGPLHRLLARSQAIVHHGGMGTAAAAASAGVPQVVVSRAFAGPANASWLAQCGVGDILQPYEFTFDNVKAALLRCFDLNRDHASTRRNRLLASYNPGYLDGVCDALASALVPVFDGGHGPHDTSTKSSPRRWSIHNAADYPVLLLCGMPAVGKTTFSKWLAINRGFMHIDVERPYFLKRLGLSRLWRDIFTDKWKPSRCIQKLKDFDRPIVIDWPCVPRYIGVAEQMKGCGVEVWWMNGDVGAARAAFIARGTGDVALFDRQVLFITQMANSIRSLVGSNRVDVLDAAGNRADPRAICERILQERRPQ